MKAPRSPWLATLPWQLVTLAMFVVLWFTQPAVHRLTGWWLVTALAVWLTATTLWFWHDRRQYRAWRADREPDAKP